MSRRAVAISLAALFALAGAAAAQREPRRYRAELDPPRFKAPTFQEGPLTGWYVYLDVGGKRVVCANPQVWTGPHVITCARVVAIGPSDEPPAATPAPDEDGPTAEGPRDPFPVYPAYDSSKVEKEIELWTKRLTSTTRNAARE